MAEPLKSLELARASRERYLAELKEFVAIPSVSTLSAHKPDMTRAAEWLVGQMRRMGLQGVEIMPTAGHPVVYGEWMGAPGKPVMLIYGHYDVQPVDPLDEWLSPPFEATLRGENLFARGVSDMKAQDHAFLKALEALLRSSELAVNVKLLLEGEEEIGSPSLGAFIARHRDQLKCDLALNADSGILRPDLPSLCYSLRGLAYFEVWVNGPKQDLHSGQYGGSVHNPAQVLCELIAGMHDADGHITLPGFYDRVHGLTDEERADLARRPFADEEWRAATGAPQLYGEKGYTTLERLGARPTLEVNGLLSGFTGEGSKTVLPARAMAKISMRLVPDQDDQQIEGQLRAYLARRAPPTVTWEVRALNSSPPVLVPRDTPAMRAAARALEAAFGVRPVSKREGGSVPVVRMVQSLLGVDSIIMGFGLQDDNLHSPNEKQHLPTYYRGIEAYIHFFHEAAQLG